MIDSLSIEIEHPEQLAFFLASTALQSKYKSAASSFMLIYSAVPDEFFLNQIRTAANFWCPATAIVGATSTGEILHGETLLGKTIITLYFFETSQVHLICQSVSNGEEAKAGAEIVEALAAIDALKGVMLIGNPLGYNFAGLLASLEAVTQKVPVFGGGAGDYAMEQAWVIGGKRCAQNLVVAVAFSGPELHMELQQVLGWRRMTPSMKVTSTSGTAIHTIDDKPASDVYRHFLGIDTDEQFFSNALGFPLLIEQQGTLVAKVPVAALDDGSLMFLNQFTEGEEFGLGFVHPELLEDQLQVLNQKMASFFPDTVLLFSCGCRRFVLLDDILDETRSFEQLAPTFGFYTVGEIAGNSELQTLSLVALGMREGERPAKAAQVPVVGKKVIGGREDKFVSTHSRVLKRLLSFISTLNSELEAKNREMEALSYLDGLTGIANRRRFEMKFQDEWARGLRHRQPLTLMMLDVDSFKAFNDNYGHMAGDDCLRQLAKVMGTAVTRSSDLVARYGGEEFAVILPDTNEAGGCLIAEEIQHLIALLEIPHQHTLADSEFVTISIGVATVIPTARMSPDMLQASADDALYQAKRLGRNKIELSPGLRSEREVIIEDQH